MLRSEFISTLLIPEKMTLDYIFSIILHLSLNAKLRWNKMVVYVGTVGLSILGLNFVMSTWHLMRNVESSFS